MRRIAATEAPDSAAPRRDGSIPERDHALAALDVLAVAYQRRGRLLGAEEALGESGDKDNFDQQAHRRFSG